MLETFLADLRNKDFASPTLSLGLVTFRSPLQIYIFTFYSDKETKRFLRRASKETKIQVKYRTLHMNSGHDSRNLPGSSRRQRSPQQAPTSSGGESSGEPKRLATRSGRKRRSPLATVTQPTNALKNYRGGNDLLVRTAAEGAPIPPPSRNSAPDSFRLTNTQTEFGQHSSSILPHPSTFSGRPEFSFPDPADTEKQRKDSLPDAVDVATCSKDLFDKWLTAVVAAIPPSTASTASLRSGAIGPQKAQKNFFIRESILNTMFGTLQSALDVLQRYRLELAYHKNLLQAYFSAVEEDAQDHKPHSAKFTVFHHSMREKGREQPVVKYQLHSEEICGRIDKLLYVINRLETLEGLNASEENSLADLTSANNRMKKQRMSPFHQIYGDDDDVNPEEDNSDEDDLDAFPDGSAEKERILSKMRKSRLLKVLAKKSKGLEICLHLPTLPHEISSRLRNELVLPFSARVLSLKEISSKNGREDQIGSFVEWYVTKIVDPFAMSQLLRIVPMEYVVTTTCRLVSACDVNLSLRAAQALPDFSHVMIRAVREGRDEAFAQLALSPSVSFLAALQSPLPSTILFYASLLLGHLDVVRRVLSEGFFHPQALLVLLFFNANWASEDCAAYLRHQLQLCQEMSELREQLQKRRIPSVLSGRTSKCSPRTVSPSSPHSTTRPESEESLRSSEPTRDGTATFSRSKEERVYDRIEASLKLFFSADGEGTGDLSIADQFIYGPLERLRVLLEMREQTHQQLYEFMTSRAAAGASSLSMAGKDPTAAMLQELGVDGSSIGGVLRRELEALRWHSFFGGKNKNATTAGGAIVEGIGAQPLPQKVSTTGTGEDDDPTQIGVKLSGTFGYLLRGKWMDAVVGHPLQNVMLPAFSTMWLRRADARSFLPIAPCHKPLLIRSDCYIDSSEDLSKKVRLYPEDEALEVKEVKEAEELRSERTRSALEYITATQRATEMAKEAREETKKESAGSQMYRVGQGTNAQRRNRQIRMAETYDDNYYFEAHVSLDYLILSRDRSNHSDSLPSIPVYSRSQGTKSSSEDPTNSSEGRQTQLSNSLIIGFCSENMEGEALGVLSERLQPLGMKAGSGGVSLHVVGHRIIGEAVVENGMISEQEEEVMLKVMKHHNGKVTPVNLPCTEKQQAPDASPRPDTHASSRPPWSRGGLSTGDTNRMTTPRFGNVSVSNLSPEYKHREGHNSSTIMDSAPYIFIRILRRRPVPNAYGSLSNSGSAATVSDMNNSLQEENKLPGNQFTYLGTPRVTSSHKSRAEDEEIEETTFPLAHFVTEREFLEWDDFDPAKSNRTMEINDNSPFSSAGSIKERETVGVNSTMQLSRVPTAQSFHSGLGPLPSGETKVDNCNLFGNFGIALGFFLDMKKNTVSLGINGIPIGVLFARVGVWPVTRLYPAATIQSSPVVVDRLLLSEEASNYRATPPVLRFAFEFSDIIGDQLLDTRNHWEVGTARIFCRQHAPGGTMDANPSTPAADMTLPLYDTFGSSEAHSRPSSSPIQAATSCPSFMTGTSGQSASQWPDAQLWLRGVKLFDKTHKFKQMLTVLSNAVVNESSSHNDTETPKDGGDKIASDKPTSPQSASKDKEDNNTTMESQENDTTNHTAGKGSSALEITTYQRTQSLLNQLSSGGFQDFIFFPSIHIRRRSDDGWSDLHHNGIAIIPERAVLSPLCAALACRQQEMALSIASHFMTNMYHSTDTAIRQRRLLSSAHVLLERIPVYEVLSLFSIQIQREELELLRRDHRKRNVLMSKMYLLKDTSAVDSSGRGPKRRYAVTPLTKLDPQKMYSSKATQYTPIHCAFLGGNHTKVINALLNYLYIALSFKSHAQLTATYCKEYREMEAAGKICYVAQTFPHLKDSVNVHSRAGESALLIATRMNNDVIAKRLLAFGAAPDCQDRISRAFALEIACANRFLPIAEALFSTEAYSTPLMVNHAGVATPLCWCAINNIPEMIPLLLQNGADPMKGLDGNSPLLLAVTFKSEKAALCLLENCRNAREPISSENNSPERRRMPAINVDDVDSRTQCTALHIACELGLVEVVRALLRFHASLTIFTKATYVTPLHTAILNGKRRVALTLLEYGKDQLRRGTSALDINAIDKNGNAPLHLAARAGMTDVVEYIAAQFSAEEMEGLSKNPRNGHTMKPPAPVDFSRTNNQGKIPLLVAIQFHEVKCAELIVAYSYKKILYPGGPVMEGTCMAILQACASHLDELVLLLLSYPQFQVHPNLREDFMHSYTARRADFDRLEAKMLAEAKRAKREAARRARQEESDYRYFPLSPDEEEESEEEDEEDDEESQPPAYIRPRFSIFAKRAFCPGSKRMSEYGSLARRPKTKLSEGKRRGTVRALEKAEAKQQGASQANHRRSFIRDLFSRTRANISPDVALKLLLRGFALPELFVMLEEVSTQSMVVGIQSPSAMVHGESLLGFLKEHFDVSIGPSNAVKFCRDVLEHIVTLFENMGAKSNSIPSWYHCRDKINDALRRYPPFCQQIIRTIRLHGRTDGCKRAIEDIRAAVSKYESRSPLMHEKFHLDQRDGKVNVNADEKRPFEAHLTPEEMERLFTTPFKYTVLQLCTCLGLAPLVSYLLNEVHVSPFFCPVQVMSEEEPNMWRESAGTGSKMPHSSDTLPSTNDDRYSRCDTGGLFDYDIRREPVPAFRDLFNLTEEKWCCTPYRLSIRSFHAATVGVYLRLFQHSSAASAAANGGQHNTLSVADRRRVQWTYKSYFGIDGDRLSLASMAADFREPMWVDRRGNTPLQEVLMDHLASRLSGDDVDDNDYGRDRQHTSSDQMIHLHHLSSLEMYRGDIRTSARTIGKRLLKCGAATCGCFNADGMDGWLIAFALDGEAGRAATTLLLHNAAPLLGCVAAHRSSPTTPNKAFTDPGYTGAFSKNGPEPTGNDKEDNAGSPTDPNPPIPEIPMLTEKERISEELQFLMPHILAYWEEAGYGIPNSTPQETFERLVFSSPIEGDPNMEAVRRKESSATVVPETSQHQTVMQREQSELIDDSNAHPADPGRIFAETMPPEPKGTDILSEPSHHTTYNETDYTRKSTVIQTVVPRSRPDSSKNYSLGLEEVMKNYTIYLLFLCVEHNHSKLIDLLTQYPTVLSSAVRHPFTRDSLLTRLIKRAVEQLIFLKEVPVIQVEASLTMDGNGSERLAEGSNYTITNKDIPFSVLVGTAISDGLQRQHQGDGWAQTATDGGGTEREADPLLDETDGTGALTQAYRDPYKIPVVRSLLEVAKSLLDNFDVGNRFEPSSDGETTLSLASITGHAPLVSRIVNLQSKANQLILVSATASRKLDLSHTTAEYPGHNTPAIHWTSFEPANDASPPSQSSGSNNSAEVPPAPVEPKLTGSMVDRIPEMPPPALVETYNPSPAYTLSTALDDAIVRTLLATRLYWGEDDAGTLYALLNNIEGTDNQVAFLAMAYPNIHPLPALWLAAQYVSYARVLLHSHECNIAFWANLLYAQFTGRLEELPIQGHIWSELLHVLLPRAPAIPIYLIHCHAADMEAIGSRNSHMSARRRVGETAVAGSNPNLLETTKSELHNRNTSSDTNNRQSSARRLSSELPTQTLRAYDRYPRLKVQQQQQPSLGKDVRVVSTDRTQSEGSVSVCSASASQLTSKCPPINNWSHIVRRIDSFLKVSALVAADSLLGTASGMPSRSKAKKGERAGEKKDGSPEKRSSSVSSKTPRGSRKSMAVAAVPQDAHLPMVGLTGTLLLDVVEVAARYDHADEVIKLIRVQDLVMDVKDGWTSGKGSTIPSSTDDQATRDREHNAILSRAMILSSCPSLTAASSLHNATNTLATMERLLWKELIEAKHLDLIAVAAGSRRLLQRLYEDTIASAFVSTLRYDRINIATGIPEGMVVPTENPEEVRALPGYAESTTFSGAPLYNPMSQFSQLRHTAAQVHVGAPSHQSELHNSPFRGWIREYINTSFKALAHMDGESAAQAKNRIALYTRNMDDDEFGFCRISVHRAAIGTPYDRNDIAKTTWGIGAAAQLLTVGGTKKNKTKASTMDAMEAGENALEMDPLAPTDTGNSSAESPGGKRVNGFGNLNQTNNSSITTATPRMGDTLSSPPHEPKPVYQLFLQTDWVVHSSQVLRSPRPSVQTIDVLVLLLERRCALSCSALQLFFAASHFTNRWRTSNGEAITINYQTRTHHDTLLHLLVINDQYQLVEYFLTYTLYYVCKWSFDDPNLKPGVFSVREEYLGWEKEKSDGEVHGSTTDSEIVAVAQAASGVHGGMHEKEPSTFLRMMLRLNCHGLTPFDYAHSPNMVQLLQRFGCVPPSYRPNPHTFTRALGLDTMLDSDTAVAQKKYFQVPQLILASENFLFLQDGDNNIKINRQAGIKGNEQARVKYEKSLLAAFNAVASGKKGEVVEEEAPKAPARLTQRAGRGKDAEGAAEAGLVKHLLSTQKITGTLILPLILNEDVSLLHLGLCAHDDMLVQMYSARRNNLRKTGSIAESGAEAEGMLPEIGPDARRKLMLPSAEDEDGEDKEFFTPYMLSLLPPDLTNPKSEPSVRMKSPVVHKLGASLSVKLPPLESNAPPSADLGRSMPSVTQLPPDKGAVNANGNGNGNGASNGGARKGSPRPRANHRPPKAKAPLSQRDVMSLLEKRQFVVYPLNLPPQQVIPPDGDSTADGRRLSMARRPSSVSRPTTSKKARRGKAAATAAAMAEGVFLAKELALQQSNAEEVVEETDEMHQAAFMVSLTPMQLVQCISKGLPQGSLTPQYCSIHASKLDTYFSLVALPEDIGNMALLRRHRAAKVIMEANNETDRIARNLLLYRNTSSNDLVEDPLQQVVTVPMFQPDAFSISAARTTSLADILDDWVKQHELRMRFGNSVSGRSDWGKRKSKAESLEHTSRNSRSSSTQNSVRSSTRRTNPIPKASIVGGSTAINRRVSIIDEKGNVLADANKEEVEVEQSPIHTAKPVGGVAPAEQQSLMRVLLRQFSTSAGGKLAHEMGMTLAPNYDLETHGDPISALHAKTGGKFSTEVTKVDRRPAVDTVEESGADHGQTDHCPSAGAETVAQSVCYRHCLLPVLENNKYNRVPTTLSSGLTLSTRGSGIAPPSFLFLYRPLTTWSTLELIIFFYFIFNFSFISVVLGSTGASQLLPVLVLLVGVMRDGRPSSRRTVAPPRGIGAVESVPRLAWQCLGCAFTDEDTLYDEETEEEEEVCVLNPGLAGAMTSREPVYADSGKRGMRYCPVCEDVRCFELKTVRIVCQRIPPPTLPRPRSEPRSPVWEATESVSPILESDAVLGSVVGLLRRGADLCRTYLNPMAPRLPPPISASTRGFYWPGLHGSVMLDALSPQLGNSLWRNIDNKQLRHNICRYICIPFVLNKKRYGHAPVSLHFFFCFWIAPSYIFCRYHAVSKTSGFCLGTYGPLGASTLSVPFRWTGLDWTSTHTELAAHQQC
eukprot:gene4054-2904_t